MTSPGQSAERDAVSPLELFFDLVFVFAVSQLSRHLLDHLSWRGAAETLPLLIAVFGVWSGTSFEATLLNLGRSQAQWMLLAVMLAGLFMNAAIAHAFEAGGWAFVVPLLVIQAGRSILMIVAAPTRMLREHYARLLCWILATAPLWITGAVVQAEVRLLWWAGAAVIDLAGTWLAHPLPRRALRSENVEFDADHMIERCRLFLLIALGESVLSSGTALADAPRTLLTLVTGTAALATIVALWALHFAASGRLLDRYVETTTDPILAARRTLNGLLVSVAGLVAVAVGNELVITHPHGQASVALSLLLFGGPLLYLGSQTVYLWAVIGSRSLPRLAGIAALVVAGGLSHLLPAYAALGLLVTLLLVLVVIVVRDGMRPHADSSRTGRPDRRADRPARSPVRAHTARTSRSVGASATRILGPCPPTFHPPTAGSS